MKQKGIKFAKTRIGLGRVTTLLSSTTLLDNLFRIFFKQERSFHSEIKNWIPYKRLLPYVSPIVFVLDPVLTDSTD